MNGLTYRGLPYAADAARATDTTGMQLQFMNQPYTVRRLARVPAVPRAPRIYRGVRLDLD